MYAQGVDPLRRGGGRRGVRLEGRGGRDQGSRQGLGGACELTLRVGRGSLRRRGALEAVPVDVPGRARLQGADPQTLLKLAYGDQRLDRLGQGHLVDGPASGGRDGNGGQGADNGNDRAEVSNSLDHFRQARGDVADRRGERTAERGEQRLEGVGEILEFRRRGLVDALGLLVQLGATGELQVGAVEGLADHVHVVGQTRADVDVADRVDAEFPQDTLDVATRSGRAAQTVDEGEQEVASRGRVVEELGDLGVGHTHDLAEFFHLSATVADGDGQLVEDAGEGTTGEFGPDLESRQSRRQTGGLLSREAEEVGDCGDGGVDAQDLLVGGGRRGTQGQDGGAELFHGRDRHLLHLRDTAEEDRGLLAGHTRGQRELHDGVGETGKVLLGDTDRGTELTDTGDLLEGDRRVLRDLLEALQQTDGSGFRLANHSGDLRERLLLGDRGCGHGRGHLGEHIEERLEGALQLTHGVAQGERGAR